MRPRGHSRKILQSVKSADHLNFTRCHPAGTYEIESDYQINHVGELQLLGDAELELGEAAKDWSNVKRLRMVAATKKGAGLRGKWTRDPEN